MWHRGGRVSDGKTEELQTEDTGGVTDWGPGASLEEVTEGWHFTFGPFRLLECPELDLLQSEVITSSIFGHGHRKDDDVGD